MMEFENLIRLIETVSRSELTGFKYEKGGVKLSLTKKQGKVQVVSAPPAVDNMAAAAPGTLAVSSVNAKAEISGNAQNPLAEKEGNYVDSPLVGTFYAAASEDAQAFVSVGDTVKKGQVLAIIEAMKLMNEIESEYDGVVAEVLVENAEAVEYGQPLFRIV